MNTHRLERHLSHDELLIALVNADDLKAGRQAHFNNCPACRHAFNELAQRFERIGKMAQHLSPAPARPFRLPEQKQKTGVRYIRPLIAASLAAVLVFVVSIWLPQRFDDPAGPPAMTAQSLEADRRLMQEVDDLVRNALPQPYRRLAAVSEPRPELDEDLINRIVPSIEEGHDQMT